jgi:hypothetical protein
MLQQVEVGEQLEEVEISGDEFWSQTPWALTSVYREIEKVLSEVLSKIGNKKYELFPFHNEENGAEGCQNNIPNRKEQNLVH